MKSKDGVQKVSGTVKTKLRRENVIKRLSAQLLSGIKNSKEGEIPLTDLDKKRIEKELVTLKNRI